MPIYEQAVSGNENLRIMEDMMKERLHSIVKTVEKENRDLSRSIDVRRKEMIGNLALAL